MKNVIYLLGGTLMLAFAVLCGVIVYQEYETNVSVYFLVTASMSFNIWIVLMAKVLNIKGRE